MLIIALMFCVVGVTIVLCALLGGRAGVDMAYGEWGSAGKSIGLVLLLALAAGGANFLLATYGLSR